MKYKASLDKLAIIITICITLLFAGGIAAQYMMVQDTAVPSLVSLLLVIIYLVTFLLRPLYYTVTDTVLIIHRPIGKVVVERSRIQNVSLPGENEMKGIIRTFGVGGLFGYFGRFSSYPLGSMNWYATRRNRLVLITTTDGRKIVVTPDETGHFLAAFGK